MQAHAGGLGAEAGVRGQWLYLPAWRASCWHAAAHCLRELGLPFPVCFLHNRMTGMVPAKGCSGLRTQTAHDGRNPRAAKGTHLGSTCSRRAGFGALAVSGSHPSAVPSHRLSRSPRVARPGLTNRPASSLESGPVPALFALSALLQVCSFFSELICFLAVLCEMQGDTRSLWGCFAWKVSTDQIAVGMFPVFGSLQESALVTFFLPLCNMLAIFRLSTVVSPPPSLGAARG